jgi:hypothetical protein
MIAEVKEVVRTVLNDGYTVLMISMVIYALSFMCQPFERGLMRVLILVIFADGVMRIAAYLLNAQL